LKAFISSDLVSHRRHRLNSMKPQTLTSRFSIIQFSFYASSIAFILQRTHLLIALLCLEGIILTLVLYVPSILYISNIIIPTIRIVILSFGACEASLGLRIIVYISRSYGSDMLNSATLNKC
jgi:NADH:ubiquinone oxidoreductase subunit K